MSLHVLEFVRDTQGLWVLPAECLARLRARFAGVSFSAPPTQADADALLPEVDVVVGSAVKPHNLSSAARLRWIHSPAAGVGHLLFPALIESPVIVTNSRGLHAVDMAEHALAMMLEFARKLHLARDDQHAKAWQPDRLWKQPAELRRLEGSTVLVIGLGAVGSAIATRARAFGMRVLAVRRHPRSNPEPATEQHGLDALHACLGRAEWVVLAAPLTGESLGLIGRREIESMRPDAVLVNLGRGKLVDETALVEALQSGRIAGAALDVFEKEPLPADSPLWTMPQVIVSPHVSGLGPRYWERLVDIFAGNLERFIRGETLHNLVDKRAGY
jgi:phosphoglycerate dehydrogenase-like enzyme